MTCRGWKCKVAKLYITTGLFFSQWDFYIERGKRKLPLGILTNLILVRVVWHFLASDCIRRSSVSQTVVQIETHEAPSACKWSQYELRGLRSLLPAENCVLSSRLNEFQTESLSTISLVDGWWVVPGFTEGEKGVNTLSSHQVYLPLLLLSQYRKL